MVPSPPKTRRRSTLLASAAVSASEWHLRAASCAVAASQKSFRPLRWISLAALWTSVRLETFPEFASSPTLRILSATLFNQYQEFFVPRRPQQRRLDNAAPGHSSDFRYELFQLFQHARVNRRIGDHALATVSLFFARLELRLDER